MSTSDQTHGIIRETGSGKALNLAKTFLFMFIMLAITAGVSIGIGIPFQAWFKQDPTIANNTLLGFTIGAGFGVIIVSFLLQYAFLKKGKSAFVWAIVYSCLIGVLLSSFVAYLPWQVLSGAFGITALIFGVLALAGILLKKFNLNVLGLIGFGIFAGIGLVFLFSWIFMLFIPGFAFWTSVIFMGVTFIAIMLLTIYDVWRINQIAEMGNQDSNLSLYCAVTLYVDFIQIFIRILWFIVMASRR